MNPMELADMVGTWLRAQGYNSENCNCARFISWYLQNYPNDDKSIPDAFYTSDWRKTN